MCCYVVVVVVVVSALDADEMEVVGDRDAEREERDYEDYRQQLEADKEMRRMVGHEG